MSAELCKHDMNPAWCADCLHERTVRCRGCHRPLHDELSIMLGTGSTCFLTDTKAQEKVQERIAASPTGWIRTGIIPLYTAQQWSHALKQVDGVLSGYRYDEQAGTGYRIYAGHPNVPQFYVTFGQRYAREPHPKFALAHPDGYLVLEAEDEGMAREGAFILCGPHFAFLYDHDEMFGPRPEGRTTAGLFPRGELARFRVSARPSGAITVDPSGIVS